MNNTPTKTMNAWHLFVPDRAGLMFVFILALLLFASPLLLLSDGGTCRHFLTGIYFFDHHVVLDTNWLSAVAPNSTWRPHEFGADLMFGAAYALFHLNGLVLISSIALSLAIICSYQISRQRGLGVLCGLIMMVALVAVSSLHWAARPHILTYLPFLATYYLVFVSNVGRLFRLVVLFFVILFWANIHGSFPLALAMLICKAAGDAMQTRTAVIDARFRRSDSAQWNLATLIAALVASSINIAGGPGFLGYILGYLTNPVIQFKSTEWTSIDFSYGLRVWIFVAIILFVVAVWVYAKEKPRLAEFSFMMALLVFSLYAMRMMPYFAMACLLAIAPQWHSLASELINKETATGLWRPLRQMIILDQKLHQQEPSSPVTAGIWIVLSVCISIFWLVSPNCWLKDFNPAALPAVCSDYLVNNKIKGLGFSRDNWEGYLYWKTGNLIFMDDATDFYPKEIVDAYSAIYFNYPSWKEVLNKYDFRWVLVPRGLPLAFHLQEESAWRMVCKDEVSVLFLRR